MNTSSQENELQERESEDKANKCHRMEVKTIDGAYVQRYCRIKETVIYKEVQTSYLNIILV